MIVEESPSPRAPTGADEILHIRLVTLPGRTTVPHGKPQRRRGGVGGAS